MALLLLRSGKQILRLSSSLSSAAAVAATSQQRLGGVSSKYLFSTYATPKGCFASPTYYFPKEFKPKKQQKQIEIPKKTWKNFFANLFKAPPPPPHTLIFQELLGKFMDLAEQSKNCPEDRLPLILDDIRPILKSLLKRMTNECVTRFVYEFARPAASSPPVVIDRKVKAIVDQLPTHVIHLFTDMLIDLIERTYAGGSYGVTFDPNSKSFVLTADVSHLLKEHLKVFVVKDYLMITGTDKNAPPAIPQLLALAARIDNILKMPSCLYSRDELAASVIVDHEQPASRELKIVVPKTEVLVENPTVFQLNLVTKCVHQG